MQNIRNKQNNSFEESVNECFVTAKKEVNERFDEVLSVVNDGFARMQEQFDELKGESAKTKEDVKELKTKIAKCPTESSAFKWADSLPWKRCFVGETPQRGVSTSGYFDKE